MKKKLHSFVLLSLLSVSRFAFADPFVPGYVALQRAGYPEWMSSYISGSFDSGSPPSFAVSTHVESESDLRYKVVIEGYVNIGTVNGLEYLTRILPERLEIVKAYFEYWRSLGYDVDFEKDVVLDIRTMK